MGDFPTLSETNRVDLLRLNFWDIANPSQKMVEVEDPKLFNKDQADQIISFVNRNWDKINVLMVHCEAGLSRSPAIAAAITYFKIGKDETQWYFHKYMPNGFVYKTILEHYYGPHSVAVEETEKMLSDVAYNVFDEPWDCKE